MSKKPMKVADSIEELFDEEASKEPKISINTNSSQETIQKLPEGMICPPPIAQIPITKKAFTDLILICCGCIVRVK